MKFSDVLDIRNGRNQRQVENANGKDPIYGSGGVMGRATDFICDAGTVVIGRKGSINNPFFVDEPFWNVDTAFGLVAHRDVLLPKYLFYFCVNFDFEQLNTTVTIPSLTKANLLQIEINVPDMDEQRYVVRVLDKICRLTDLQQQELHNLDQLVKSRFIELFASVEAEDTLQNLCTFIDYRGKTPEKVESGLPFITAKNIRMHRMSFDTLEYISKETYDRVMTRGFPQIGDVVFTTEAPLGNVCRIPFIETEFYIGQRIITMQTERLEPAYLEYALSSDEFKRKIAEKSSGSTVTGIRSKLLEQLTIPVPPRALQERFAAFVEQTDKSKLAVQKGLQELEILKKSLMQQYFG